MNPQQQIGHRAWTIVSVALIVGATSGTLTYWAVELGASPGSAPPNPGNGVSFGTAFDAINSSLTDLAGGPWLLTSAAGIATELPLAAVPAVNATPSSSFNETIRLCSSLPGLTVWNMTLMPLFTGSLASGAAPFWSLVFRNGSGATAFATYTLGAVRLYPPSSAVQSCATATGLASSSPVEPHIDSPEAAMVAYGSAGQAFAVNHSPLAQYYV